VTALNNSDAAHWYEANAMPEAAIDHAMAAGDAQQVARLVLNVMQPVWASGRIDTVLSWMEWLKGKTEVEHYSGIAAHAALILALLGRPGEAERWAAAAERDPGTGTLPDGNPVEATLAYLRALLCRRGVARMRADAQLALAGLSPASPYRATMLHTEAVSHLLEGDLDRADSILAHALNVATSAGAVPFIPVVLSERGIVAIERDDWHEAEAFADRALAFVRGRQPGPVLDQRTGICVRGAVRDASRRGGARPRLRGAGRSAPAAAYVRAARRVGADPARAGSLLHRPR
jgi:LuxR family maltose regulon positive regulatory protein